jgi:SAM-dependent methyltransferase
MRSVLACDPPHDSALVDRFPASALEDIEAMLYDWHNQHLLVAQAHDVAYWRALTRPGSRVLVLGAGTGRVASVLAEADGTEVTALDLNEARLRRIVCGPRLTWLQADMRSPGLAGLFDMIVAPYSAFQLLETPTDRRRTLSACGRLLTSGGRLHLDVSTSFDSRPSLPRRQVLAARCEELGADVVEFEDTRRLDDAMLVHREFLLTDSIPLLCVGERWAYHHSLDVAGLAAQTGLLVESIDEGYGAGRSTHRRVYHLRLDPSGNHSDLVGL